MSDLSTWFVRRSRDRIGPTAENSKDKDFCCATLHEVLAILCQILAPFTPFMAEEIYKNLTGEESVHLSDWPEIGQIDEKIQSDMELARKICELGHAARKSAGVKVRQPLGLLLVSGSVKLTTQFSQLIRDELNVKQVVFKPGKGEVKVELETKITSELKAEGETRDLVRKIQEMRKKSGCNLTQRILVYGPDFPRVGELRDFLKKETLADKLLPAEELHIEPVNNDEKTSRV